MVGVTYPGYSREGGYPGVHTRGIAGREATLVYPTRYHGGYTPLLPWYTPYTPWVYHHSSHAGSSSSAVIVLC